MINKGEISAICRCLNLSVHFKKKIRLFFSLNTSTDLKLGTDCFIFTQSLMILGVPTRGAAQPVHSHTVPITQQAAALSADEMSCPLTASGGSERHQHLPEGESPLQE